MRTVSLSKELMAVAFIGSLSVGTLGGLIGLGGGEFRLPLLLMLLHVPTLEAVVLNKALSLVVVTTALPFRGDSVPLREVVVLWPVIVNVLAGSLIGAWVGASGATRLPALVLRQIIAVLLVLMAGLLLWSSTPEMGRLTLPGPIHLLAGVLAGLAIGVVASFLGVAGGELIIPTLVVLFGLDIALAGSVSLVISLPTMIVGLVRYSTDPSFAILHSHQALVGLMALGSLAGTFLGGRLLGVVPHEALAPVLATVLVVSAIKIWPHGLLKKGTA